MQPKASPFLRPLSKPQAYSQNQRLLMSPSADRLPQEEDEIRGKNYIYKQTLESLLSAQEEFGEIIRLAYLTEGEEVLIDQEGLYLLQKYSTFEVAFLGFLGHDDLSRSFIIDTGLNLCSCQGNHFTNVYGRNQEEAIYIWSLPFTHNPKVKVFMLSCAGIPQEAVLQRRHQILLDFMVMLSSTIVVVNIPDIRTQRSKRIFQAKLPRGAIHGDCLQEWAKKLESCSRRIVSPGLILQKEDLFWTQSFYCLQPFKLDRSLQSKLQELFSRVNCIQIDSPLAKKMQSIEELLLSLNEPQPQVNPSFLKSISSFLIDSLKSIASKQYEALKMTGNIVCKWLINCMKYMNKKPVVKVNKIFNSIFKELYEASLLYHTDTYEQLLQNEFLNEQPKSLDSLLQIFAKVHSTVLTSFNQNIINAKIHEQYQERLLGHIGDKQQLIIDVNFRKNKVVIMDSINEIQQSTVFSPEQIRRYIEDVKAIVTRHDHNPIELIVDKLMKYSHNLEQRIIEQKIRIEQEAIQQLRFRLKEKQNQFLKSKEVNDQIRKANQAIQKNYKKQVKELHQFDGKIKAVKKEIQAQKKFQKEYMISKESKKQVAEGLLEQVRELEEKVRDNNKLMDEINKEYDYHPEILALNKKLEQQEKQVRLLERNESKIYSNIQNSFIRQAVQKTPENGSQIQKSTIRQVLQKPAEADAQQRKPIKRLSSSKK